MYYILQHLPLLPSTSHPTAAVTGTEQGGAGISTELGSGQQKRQPSGASSLRSQPEPQQQQQAGAGSTHGQPQQPQLLLQPALGGFTTSLHTVYFDNAALQLYHGRLYLRPQTQTLKARWIGEAQGTDGSEGVGFGGDGWSPEKVVLERKIYRQGWRGKLDS
jgi:SPX domain protein involved in polyphosphate accumulation